MKVTFDIDCTPEEARRFLGLPDLTPLHEAYIEKMQRVMDDGITADMLPDLMKSWGPMTDASMTMWRSMMGQASGTK